MIFFLAELMFIILIKEQEFINRIFPSCKNISIDYGILEKSELVYVYPSDFGWSDLGTWVSIDDHLEKDEDNNCKRGEQINLYDSKDNIVILEDMKEAVISGLNGYIVIQSEGSLLVCRKSDEQEIKKFVNDLKKDLKIAHFFGSTNSSNSLSVRYPNFILSSFSVELFLYALFAISAHFSYQVCYSNML